MQSDTPYPTPDQTPANYDRLSRWYDWLAESSEGPWRRVGLTLLAVQPGAHVLEIGCGTGSALGALAAAVGPDGLAFGLDLSTGMLTQSRRKLGRLQPSGRYCLVNGSGLALPWLRRCLDAIFMSFTLELFTPPQLAQVLDECARVLRPDGRLGVVALTSDGSQRLMGQLYAWAQRTWPAWIDCCPLPLLDLLTAAGWGSVQAHSGAMWGLPVGVVVCRPPDKKNGRS